MSEGNTGVRVKTCENCVRAKIRCSHSPGSLICDRCLRLKKECYFRPARPRATQKKRSTRIEALEDKIDLIMGQINRSHGSDTSHSTPKSDTTDVIAKGHTPAKKGRGHSNGTAQRLDIVDTIGKGLVSYDLATGLLQEYRKASLLFPFVAIPETTTVQELRAEKPFLLLCILTVSSFRDDVLLKSLEELLKRFVAEVILHSAHDSHPPHLETIQGLLVILAGTRQLYQLCRFSHYIHIAIGIINDSRMDRPPQHRVPTRLDVVGETDQTEVENGPGADESRALIGIFLLNSTNSIMMQKTCTFPWSPFIESCAADLSQKCEYPGDQYMIYYVQLQHMLERMNTLTASGIEGHPDVEQRIRLFRNEVEQYKNQLVVPPTCDVLIATQYHTLELQLCQISLLDKKSTTAQDNFLFSRSDILCHGLASMKRFLEYYYTLPPLLETSFNIINWLEIGFLLAAACKLVIAALDPSLRHNPQVQNLRDALDMSNILQYFINRLDHVAKSCKDMEFSHYSEWLSAAKIWFEKTFQLASLEASKIIATTSGLTQVDNGVTGFESGYGSASGSQLVDPSEGLQVDTDVNLNLFGLDFDVTIEELMGGMGGPMAMPSMFDFR
ncbi:hypothetical protein N7540_007121 [Penicillium herquei]|nr:hypothetical protein N7540_007121 [Penicillium herquei]